MSSKPRKGRCAGCGNGVMARLLRHRQTKGAEIDRPVLSPPRHIPTPPKTAVPVTLRQALPLGAKQTGTARKPTFRALFRRNFKLSQLLGRPARDTPPRAGRQRAAIHESPGAPHRRRPRAMDCARAPRACSFRQPRAAGNVDNSVEKMCRICEIKTNLYTKNSHHYKLSTCPC